MWYLDQGKEKDVVVSTRIRLARNLVDYPFEGRLNQASAKEIIDRLNETYTKEQGYENAQFQKKTSAEQMAFVEQHLVSSEFAKKTSPHELFINDDKQLYIMVCEEDHVRIQCIRSGLALSEAFEAACQADDLLDQMNHIAYNEKYGYLTHCPTNLGTGMRASVMMFLPALTGNRQIAGLQNQLSKIGLTIRGMSGEGSSAQGYLYQISNQITLGVSEEETIKKLSDVIRQIIDSEIRLRSNMKKASEIQMKDKAKRAYGIMQYAELISSEEMISLYADARLGASLKDIEVKVETLDRMLFSCMPASLSVDSKKNCENPTARDMARAKKMKEILNEK